MSCSKTQHSDATKDGTVKKNLKKLQLQESEGKCTPVVVGEHVDLKNKTKQTERCLGIIVPNFLIIASRNGASARSKVRFILSLLVQENDVA